MNSVKKNRTVSWGLLSDLLLNISPFFKMHSVKKNRTVSWGLLSDLLLNISPFFSGTESNFAGGEFFLPPLNFFSVPAKLNPAHATD